MSLTQILRDAPLSMDVSGQDVVAIFIMKWEAEGRAHLKTAQAELRDAKTKVDELTTQLMDAAFGEYVRVVDKHFGAKGQVKRDRASIVIHLDKGYIKVSGGVSVVLDEGGFTYKADRSYNTSEYKHAIDLSALKQAQAHRDACRDKVGQISAELSTIGAREREVRGKLAERSLEARGVSIADLSPESIGLAWSIG